MNEAVNGPNVNNDMDDESIEDTKHEETATGNECWGDRQMEI